MSKVATQYHHVKKGGVYKLANEEGFVQVLCPIEGQSVTFYIDFNGKSRRDKNDNRFWVVRGYYSKDKDFSAGEIRDFRYRDILRE